MVATTELIGKLEAWRIANGLSKTDMAQRLGSPNKHYYLSWVNRKSLPKKYYPAALSLLGEDLSAEAEPATHHLLAPVHAALPDMSKEDTLKLARMCLDRLKE